jgi:hypothetical protein
MQILYYSQFVIVDVVASILDQELSQVIGISLFIFCYFHVWQDTSCIV